MNLMITELAGLESVADGIAPTTATVAAGGQG
jgi:hypothetical protein